MAWIGGISIDIATTMRSQWLAGLVGGGLGIVTGMAKRLQVEPVQPAFGCQADLLDMIDMLGPASAPLAERMRLAIGSTQTSPLLAAVKGERVDHAGSPSTSTLTLTPGLGVMVMATMLS
jgi:hypothetical protein